jgi:hypothetical protein
MVLAVQQHDSDGLVTEFARGIQPCEPTADDNYARIIFAGHIVLMLRAIGS